ncbi:hypothetical protein [Nocardia sp. NPDC049707]|uniref:hypothetical protein n=1 Tax=Nocardia sp. NPDC049707 TaxID=3154735 RepID=UPI003429E4B3
MSLDPISDVMRRLERAQAQLMGTGEIYERSEGGRAPERSSAFRLAQADIHAAKQARNRLLVELVGDAETVPLELAQRLGLTGREATHVIDTARRGSPRLRAHVLGEPPTTVVEPARKVWTSESDPG